MRNLFPVILLFLMANLDLSAQQKDFNWRLGASAGYSNYYGDLSPHTIRGISNWDAIEQVFYFNENYFDRPSFKISLERQLSPTIGLMLSYGEYQFAMSDRYIRRDGTLWTEAPNFSRGLNFQNNTRDLGLSFVFKADNDHLLPSRSWIAPYFTIGFGILDFSVKGDLLDDQGQRYDYSSKEIIHNGTYETDLHAIMTEEGYDLWSFYTNLGLGFRIKMGPRIEFFAQTDIIHSFSDHLDDVGGKYRTSYDNEFQAYAAKPGTNRIDPDNLNRGKPSGDNDWVLYHGIGIRYNLGISKRVFKAPRISSYTPNYASPKPLILPEALEENEQSVKDDQLSINERLTRLENQQKRLSWRADSVSYRAQILAWEAKINQKENKLRAIENRRKSLLDISRNYQEQTDSLQANTYLEEEVKDSLFQVSRRRNYDLRYSLDSISRREQEFHAEIDSLGRLKANYHALTGEFMFEVEESISQASTIGIPDSPKTTVENSVPKRDEASIEIEKREASDQVLKSAAEPREGRRSEAAAGEIESSSEELQRLQQENQYLRFQRDQLLINQSSQNQERTRGGNGGRDRVIVQNQGRKNERVVVETQDGQRLRRNRWWWPFGVAGGAVAAAAILDKDEDQSLEPLRDTIFVDKAMMDWQVPDSLMLDTSLADSLGRIDLNQLFLGYPSDTLSKVESEIKALEKEVAVRDTVLVQRPENIRFLPSKVMVFFQVNQRDPDPLELKKLADLVDFVKENEGFEIILSGFADNTGNINYNLQLADDRMKAVGQALQENYGLEASQIRYEQGGQIIRGRQRLSNDQDRKVEARVERVETADGN